MPPGFQVLSNLVCTRGKPFLNRIEDFDAWQGGMGFECG